MIWRRAFTTNFISTSRSSTCRLTSRTPRAAKLRRIAPASRAIRGPEVKPLDMMASIAGEVEQHRLQRGVGETASLLHGQQRHGILADAVDLRLARSHEAEAPLDVALLQ